MADPRLEELWSDVLARWSEEPVHGVFIEHCRKAHRLDEAARRYAEAARRPDPYRSDGSRDEIAKKRLKAIATLAMFEIEGSRREREAQGEVLKARRLKVRLGALFLLVMGLLAAALHGKH